MHYLILAALLALPVISIIHLAHGIAYASRRPGYTRLQARDFPGIPGDKFEQWRRLELRRIDVFLWATWGLLLFTVIIAISVVRPLALRSARRSRGWFTSEEWTVLGVYVKSYLAYFVLSLLGRAISAIYGSRAERLKKSSGIQWPRKT